MIYTYTEDDLRAAFYTDFKEVKYSDFLQELRLRQARRGDKDSMHQLIIKTVCDYFDISLQELKSECRKRKLIEARRVYSYLTRRRTSLSLDKIGKEIKKDYSTIIHYTRVHYNLIDANDTIYINHKNNVENLLDKILNKTEEK